MTARYCLIGAGYAGNGLARALKQAGIPYDHFEATGAIGGNWSHGVYDSTHLISSKKVTQYPEYPMPAHYPTFPSAAQMLAYLNDYADHFRLRENITFNTEVTRVRPLDRTGLAGWSVELSTGEVREYAGVMIANGHYFAPKIPSYPGEFTGRQIHSKAYKRPEDFGAGGRVLVVGAGNSGSDLAVEAAATFGKSDLSMRGGYWFIPKTVFGLPSGEIERFWLPKPVVRAFSKFALRVNVGDYRRYGLRKPDHELYSKDITVTSSLFYALDHGKVRPRPEISRFDGNTVHFVDGTSGEYDTIAWATGFHTRFPMLDESMFVWEDGQPILAEHVLVPRYANIYIWGLVAPRSGAGKLISVGADFLAEVVRTQRLFPVPLSDLLTRHVPADSNILSSQNAIVMRTRIARRLLRLAAWTARLLGAGAGTWTVQRLNTAPAQPIPEKEAVS
ncbi:monooxygenase [Pseudonocardiaceae bacterium YIM PH 21723]|nr:monooxygenase [Pseudonocardiaceae bacterium YIM PH 21723]